MKKPVEMRNKEGRGLVIAGYICGILALLCWFINPLILPLDALGLAGLIIGIINLAQGKTGHNKGRVGHGIAQIIIAATAGLLELWSFFSLFSVTWL